MPYAIVDAGDVEPSFGNVFRQIRQRLGVSAFGINQVDLPPGGAGREHDHAESGQEEVYLVLAGELTLLADGQEYVVRADGVVRVAPFIRRQLVNAGDEPVVLVALGGAGEHVGRDGRAWESWDDSGPGLSPQEIPLPDDLPACPP